MGACVGKETPKDKQYTSHSPTKPVATTTHAEQQMSPPKQPLEDNKPASAIIIDIEQEGNYLTLEENLRNSNLSEQQWFNEHTYAPSVIIKRSEIKKVKHKDQVNKQKDHSNKFCQFLDASESDEMEVVEGAVQQQGAYSRLVLSSKSIDIQFLLPRSRAGPLVVPMISYDKYSL